MPYLLSLDYGNREYEYRTERTLLSVSFTGIKKKKLSKMKEEGHKN